MCATMYRCPVCLHSSFDSVTALWQGLMSGASRRLTCPVCLEVLLGLDKLTLHLYSHLPTANVSNDPDMSNLNDDNGISNKPDGHSIADQESELLSDNIMGIQEVSNTSNVHTKNHHSQIFENTNETILNLTDEVDINNSTGSQDLNLDNNKRNEISSKTIPASFISVTDKSSSHPNCDSSFKLESESDRQPRVPGSEIVLNNSCLNVDTNSNDNMPLLSVPTLKHTNVEHPLNQSVKSTDLEMCCDDEGADIVTDNSTDLTNSRDDNKIKFVHYKIHNVDCWQDSQVQCKQCGALFGKQRLLNAHMHLVHPECCALSDEERARQVYPFPCHLCSKRFKMRGSLMVHVRFVHGGARLARGAKKSINSSQCDSIQQQQMVANNTSAPLPNNDSPEPFFPSLSELSEQLSASPPQHRQNYDCASPNTQVPLLQNLAQHHSTLEITEVDETENQSQSALTRQSYSQIPYESKWDKDSKCPRESMQVDITSQSQQWISSSIKKNIQPLSLILNKSSNDMENLLANKYITTTHKQVCIPNDKNITETNTIFISNISQNEINNCNNEILQINEVLSDDILQLQTINKPVSGVAIDSNKPYECEVCFKRFTTKYFHKKHQRLHTGERPYKCSTCAKTFAFQQSFHKHLLYHTSAKPHVCSECGQAFKELSTLHNHQRIHTGERPFVCETCGKAFRQRVSYLVHRRIHTGVLPYKCSACNKSFRYKVSQRTHKCPAQPPGNVVRQSELVQRLLMKASENPDHPLASVSHESAVSCSSSVAVAQLNDNSTQSKEEISSEYKNSHFPPLLTINEESLHQLLSIFPN